jgi:hypothetical protein
MATQRRINTTEKTHLDQDEVRLEPKSNISPAVPSLVSPKPLISGITQSTLLLYILQIANTKSSLIREIIFKLLAFTVAMITFPIASYFISVDLIFGGMS